MATVTLNIESVAGVATNPADISAFPIGPWSVVGRVGTSEGNITEMQYQIDARPGQFVIPPPGPYNPPTQYSFDIAAMDILDNAHYLLTVFAFDDTGGSSSFSWTLIQNGIGAPAPTRIPPPSP